MALVVAWRVRPVSCFRAFARSHTLCPRPGQEIGTCIIDLSPKPAACRTLAGRLEAFQLAFSDPEEAGRFVLGLLCDIRHNNPAQLHQPDST